MPIRCCRPESHSADAHLGASVVRRHRSRFSAVRLGRLAETSPPTREVVLASSDMNLPSHGSCNDAPSFDISLRSVAPGFFSASPDLYCCVRDVKDPAATSWRGDGREKSQRVASDIFIRLRHSYTWCGAGGAHTLTDCTQPACTYLREVTMTVSCAPIQLEWRDQYLCPLSRPASAEWRDCVAGAFPNTPSATPPPIRKGALERPWHGNTPRHTDKPVSTAHYPEKEHLYSGGDH